MIRESKAILCTGAEQRWVTAAPKGMSLPSTQNLSKRTMLPCGGQQESRARKTSQQFWSLKSTFLAPGTSFMEDDFRQLVERGRWFQDDSSALHLLCTYFYHYYISSTSDQQVLDSGGWGPLIHSCFFPPCGHHVTISIDVSFAEISLNWVSAAKLFQSCPTLCNSVDCDPPGFPLSTGILQARILEHKRICKMKRKGKNTGMGCYVLLQWIFPTQGSKLRLLHLLNWQGVLYHCPKKTSLVVQIVKRLPTMWETWVQSLGREDLLEKEMATHSSILAWKIPWTEESGGLQSMGLQRVGHDWATSPSPSLPLMPPGKPEFLLPQKESWYRNWNLNGDVEIEEPPNGWIKIGWELEGVCCEPPRILGWENGLPYFYAIKEVG